MEHTRFVVVVLWSVAGFAGYYFLASNHALSARIWKLHPGFDKRIKAVLIQRAWGVLFLGIVSLCIVTLIFTKSPGDYGLVFAWKAAPPWWCYLALPLILIMGYYQASTPSNHASYPQIRVEQWTRGIILLSAVSWIAFLLAYEFFFRGLLLHASLELLGTWPAVALNCALYAFAHFYKGPGETFGAIPVGIFLCYLTIYTGNIWSAVIVHSVMALSNEWFSLRSHPQMKII